MLERFEVQQFRCFERVSLELGGRSVGLVGRNTSGKTSLLEALYFLAYGRSFRSNDRRQLLKLGASTFRVEACISDRLGKSDLSARGNAEAVRFQIGERQVGIAEIASRLPLHLIDPSVHRLIEGQPQERRRLLDTGVFHVEPAYLSVWRQFRRILKQRNAALRSSAATRDAPAWNAQLSAIAEQMDATRREYVRGWSGLFRATAAGVGLLGASLDYRRGWSDEHTLQTVLEDTLERDAAAGITLVGPQRADVRVLLDGRSARRVVSRGQQKLLASALVLSQMRMSGEPAREAVLLLDDPGAELDVDNLGKFLSAISLLPVQKIVTATFPAALEALPELEVFHVKQDRLARML